MTRFTRTRRRTLGTVATIALTAGLAACSNADADGGSGDSAETVPTIRFGYIADFNGAYALAVADELGLWDKYNVKVDPKVFTNGPLQIQAIQTSDLDLGSIGPGALWMAAAGDAKVVAINGLGLADRVIALPDKGISKVEDLRGKDVAVPEGTSGDMIFQLTLAEAGMTSADVNIINMDPSTTVSAVAAGQVDAAAIWYPLIDTIKNAQPGLIELTASEDFYPENTFPGTIVAGNDYAESDEDAIVRFLKVMQEANEYREENFNDVIELTSEFLKVPLENVASNAQNIKYPSNEELAEQSQDGTAAGWLSGLSELFVGMGKLDSAGEPSEYFLSDLWVQAAKE